MPRPVGARGWRPERDPTDVARREKALQREKEKKKEREKRRGGCREKVWEIWVKRTGEWGGMWCGHAVGVGGDHPHHMFHGVLQCGWLCAKHTQHTQPHALPDALIFTALPPL